MIQLFPRLSRPQLRKATVEVKKWALENDIVFKEKSFAQGNDQVRFFLSPAHTILCGCSPVVCSYRESRSTYAPLPTLQMVSMLGDIAAQCRALCDTADKMSKGLIHDH